MTKPEDHFKLSSSEGSFASRSDDVFGNLDVIEKKHNAKEQAREKFSSDRHKYMKDDPMPEDDYRASTSRRDNHDNSSKSGWSRAARDYEDKGRYRERDSRDRKQDHQFKAPRGRAPRPRFVPDYKKNPQKYTHYDLSDVTADQMSNSSNAAAAFDFLRQRRELKAAGEGNVEEPADIHKPVVFKKPKKASQSQSSEPTSDDKTEQKTSSEDKSSASYQSGKFKMSEYVVGQDSKKSKSQKASTAPAGAADKVGLQHLFEEDEDSDDDDLSKSTPFKGRNIRKRTHSSDDES